MDWFEIDRTITQAAMAAMAAMPRGEMDGNNLPAPLEFFFETPHGENVPPFFDTDDPFFDTDDDQVSDNLNIPTFFDNGHNKVPNNLNVPTFFDTDDNQVADNLNVPTIFKYADDYLCTFEC